MSVRFRTALGVTVEAEGEFVTLQDGDTFVMSLRHPHAVWAASMLSVVLDQAFGAGVESVKKTS